jgi:5-formyltetrahydrofolate cyclo-ligase
MTIQDQKADLRKKILKELKSQPVQLQLERSETIQKKLESQLFYQSARVFMYYISFEHEVRTEALIQAAIQGGFVVSVPRVNVTTQSLDCVPIKDPKSDLQPGTYGILEPKASLKSTIDPSQVDLVIVPGLGFDSRGNRLGRGKGYYDTFLKTCSKQARFCGLGYEFQMREHLPTSPGDAVMHHVVTEEGVYSGTH